LSELQYLKIKKGDKIRLTLISSNSPLLKRVQRGVDKIMYEGEAGCDLVEGERFTIIVNAFSEIQTSRVNRIFSRIINTQNSTYLVEKL
jgi:predicted RNA-binding protein